MSALPAYISRTTGKFCYVQYAKSYVSRNTGSFCIHCRILATFVGQAHEAPGHSAACNKSRHLNAHQVEAEASVKVQLFSQLNSGGFDNHQD